jgi:hypothetical protein
MQKTKVLFLEEEEKEKEKKICHAHVWIHLNGLSTRRTPLTFWSPREWRHMNFVQRKEMEERNRSKAFKRNAKKKKIGDKPLHSREERCFVFSFFLVFFFLLFGAFVIS